MNELRLTRRLLSAYYIAVVLSIFVFQVPIVKDLLAQIQASVESFILNIMNQTVSTLFSWVSLFIVCFLVVFLIRRFVVEPLGFFMDVDNDLNTIQTIVLTVAILGCLIYNMNLYFGQPMPSEFPKFMFDYLGTKQGNADSLPYLLWNLGPMVFMYFTYKKG